MSDEGYTVRVIKDLIYSYAGGAPRLADLYLPESRGRLAPVIVWVHGGGWRFGDRNLSPDLSRWFANCGFAMVTFDYRLSDEAVFPEPVIDVKTMVRWVRSVAEQYALDPNAIGLWGSSAGSQLASCAALSDERMFLSEEHAGMSSQVHAVVDGYGPTDFAKIDADRVAAPPKVPDAETVVVKIAVPTSHADSFESRHIGVPVTAGAPEVVRANPATYAHAGAPPFLILHGESDALVPWTQSQILYDALANAENDVTFVKYERLGHGFFNNSGLDETDIGPAVVTCSRDGSDVPIANAKVFALCEKFFRDHLAQRAVGLEASAA